MAPQTTIPLAATVLGTIGTMYDFSLNPSIRYPSHLPYPNDLEPQLLVDPTHPSNMAELPYKIHRRTPRQYDVHLVGLWSSIRRLRHRSEFQYPDSGPGSDLLCLVTGLLGSVYGLLEVCLNPSGNLLCLSRRI